MGEIPLVDMDQLKTKVLAWIAREQAPQSKDQLKQAFSDFERDKPGCVYEALYQLENEGSVIADGADYSLTKKGALGF